ncbi:hypothetical protein LXA43DRAFT_902670 [Ganoderma leucocontextum]|nr:hypothetical protein LXA43DRAFT_902670 [Ganoderma leucocontextum]
MFLAGVLPGHPSMEQLNHLIRPLITCFCDGFSAGVWFTSTPLHPDGKLSRYAIIPVVADLLAARQLSGFAPHNHTNFCSLCTQKLGAIEELDYRNWRQRSVEEHREIATAWKEASTEAEQAHIYETYGVRWSELLRLPYWNPTEFVALDSMHLFYLGMLHRHCEQVWGMGAKYRDGLDGIAYDPDKKPPTPQELQDALKTLRTGSEAALLLGRDRLKLVWDDISKTSYPSWFSPAPSRVSATGTTSGMKADQWRSFGIVHLPISLINCWGHADPVSREYKILANLMDLVTAVRLASKRKLTPYRRALYRTHMHRYLETLLELFPGTTISPNQHLSLHWPDVAEKVGPSHATRCFAFEHNNFILQQIQTNHRVGEYPSVVSVNKP